MESHLPDNSDVILRDLLLDLVNLGEIEDAAEITNKAVMSLLTRPQLVLDDVMNMTLKDFVFLLKTPPIPEGYDTFAWGNAVFDRFR